MNTLEKIIKTKKQEVKERKELYPIALLKKSKYFFGPVVSLKAYLNDPTKSGVIAEIKRKSPSRGWINKNVSVEEISIAYMQSGASGLSILTDQHYFGGSLDDLETARKFNFCPILRKDFIIDDYQIYEARAHGADVILLIAAALTPKQTNDLIKLAHELGLEVLLELHQEDEIDTHLHSSVDVVGINSRNLKTMDVSIDNLEAIHSKIPKTYNTIAESGLENPDDIRKLKSVGFQGFLVGSNFMMHNNPGKACKQFHHQLF